MAGVAALVRRFALHGWVQCGPVMGWFGIYVADFRYCVVLCCISVSELVLKKLSLTVVGMYSFSEVRDTVASLGVQKAINKVRTDKLYSSCLSWFWHMFYNSMNCDCGSYCLL